jgi:hypothetical protein
VPLPRLSPQDYRQAGQQALLERLQPKERVQLEAASKELRQAGRADPARDEHYWRDAFVQDFPGAHVDPRRSFRDSYSVHANQLKDFRDALLPVAQYDEVLASNRPAAEAMETARNMIDAVDAAAMALAWPAHATYNGAAAFWRTLVSSPAEGRQRGLEAACRNTSRGLRAGVEQVTGGTAGTLLGTVFAPWNASLAGLKAATDTVRDDATVVVARLPLGISTYLRYKFGLIDLDKDEAKLADTNRMLIDQRSEAAALEAQLAGVTRAPGRPLTRVLSGTIPAGTLAECRPLPNVLR